MPLVYYCLSCGRSIPAGSLVKDNGENKHRRGTLLCGPVDVWEQDKREDFEEFDESETNI